MKDVNPNESNIGEESHSFDGEELPNQNGHQGFPNLLGHNFVALVDS